jgi:Flp pilus assembly protein TadG
MLSGAPMAVSRLMVARSPAQPFGPILKNARAKLEAANMKNSRAQATVEFALVLPVFMLLTAGAIQFGQLFFAYAQLLQAAQEGARYGAVLHHTDAEIIARVRQVSPGGAADNVTVATTVSPTNSGAVAASSRAAGNVLAVTASHTQQLVIPFFALNSVPLTGRTSMVVE